IAVMQKGAIAQVADPVTLYRQPASASIASFLGVSNVFQIARVDRATSSVVTSYGHRLYADVKSAGDADNSICFRPEDITIEAESGDKAERENGSNGNVLSGSVKVSSYQGATVRYQVHVDDGPEVEVVQRVQGYEYH